MTSSISALSKLDARRRALGMTIDVVAKRSGVSKSTVDRVLSGQYGAASFDTVAAIATALGAAIVVEDSVDTDDMLAAQAELKARQLVGIVQGTSALEGQGIPEDAQRSMVRQAVYRLLAGSRRRLWAS